jgi:hypothetical protein
MEWQWQGPLNGGITQSLIQKYLTNPYTFVLYYGLGLEEPEEYNQNLLWGNVMHKGLEIGLASSTPIKDQIEQIKPELIIEAKKWPYINTTTVSSVLQMLKLYNDDYKQQFYHSSLKITANEAINSSYGVFKDFEDSLTYNCKTEQQFKILHRTNTNNIVSLMGKVDGIGIKPCGTIVLIEHKCKGSYDKAQFRKEIHTDLQLNIYCKANKVNHYVYDNILIPETQWNCPARDMMERHDFYINRLYNTHNWGSYPVAKKSFMWLDQYTDQLPQEGIDDYFLRTVDPIIDQIVDLYNYCSEPSFDPFNPACFNKMYFNRPLRLFDPAKTDKFKMSYWNFLSGQIDKSGLVPTKELFKELKGEG